MKVLCALLFLLLLSAIGFLLTGQRVVTRLVICCCKVSFGVVCPSAVGIPNAMTGLRRAPGFEGDNARRPPLGV